MSLEEEREFLAPFLEQAATGGVLVVGQIKAALDLRLGREMALALAYNLLHRLDWKKIALDKRRPQSDPQAQDEWKKTPPNACRNPPRLGAMQSHQADVPGRGALVKHISDVRRCWVSKPIRPICQAMLTHEYTYAYGVVDVCIGELDRLILPHVNTECMQLFRNEVSARHPDERIVMLIDGAGRHQ